MAEKDFLLQQKVYDMILYAYPALEQMPKSQKFSLAQDIKRCMDRVMRLVITANKKYTKKTTLQELDVEVAALKVYIRIAYDLRYLPAKKYEYWWKLAKWWVVGGAPRDCKTRQRLRVSRNISASTVGLLSRKKQRFIQPKNFGRALCYSCQKKAKEQKE